MCVGQTSGRDLVVFWAIAAIASRSSPRLDLVSWSPPLEYSVAAGSIATPAFLRLRPRRRRTVLAVAGTRAYSSQGPTIDGRVKPRHRRPRQRSSATYGGVPLPVRFRRDVGLVSGSRRCGGARQAGIPEVHPGSDQGPTDASARDLGEAGLDSVYGAGELQLPKPPDIVAPTIAALAARAARQGDQAALRVSDDSGEVSVVEQVKLGRRTWRTIKRGVVRRGSEVEDRRRRPGSAPKAAPAPTSTASA